MTLGVLAPYRRSGIGKIFFLNKKFLLLYVKGKNY